MEVFIDREGVEWFRWNGGDYNADPAGDVNIEIVFRANGTFDVGHCCDFSWSDNPSIVVAAYRIVEE